MIPIRYRNGIILGYHIALNNTKLNTFRNFTIHINQTTQTFNQRNYTAVGLKYFSTYKISLQAFTVAGIGPSSHLVQIATLESGVIYDIT